MPTNDLFYHRNEYLIVSVLFALLLLVVEGGFQLGRKGSLTDTAKSHRNSLQSGMLGLLGLLLAFTFAMAVTRFDTRTHAVVDEANAIGTTVLRAQMLPAASGDAALKLLHEYVDARISVYDSNISLAESQRAAKGADLAQERLWRLAVDAGRNDPYSIPIGLFVRALNNLIDQQAARDAARRNHVPESVLILLFLVTLLTLWQVGYTGGSANTRQFGMLIVISAAVCLVVLIIIDLDRPRRGLIMVSQQPMLDLRNGFDQPGL